MDTPEKTRITTPLSKFEDSPVFNYINSLSPIKPAKSIHITQTFHSLSFSSLPSIFTSPHVSSNKESRFFRRHNYAGSSKPEFSTEKGNKVCSDEGVIIDVTQLYDNLAEIQENYDPAVSMNDASVEPSSEDLKFAIELPGMLKYDCGSPDCEPTPHCGIQTDCVSELAGTSTSIDHSVKAALQETSPEGEVLMQGIQHLKQKKKDTECDWESLMSDTSDLLIFNSPINPEAFKGLIQKSLDTGSRFCSLSEMYKMQIVDPVGSGEQHEMEDPSTQPGETIEPKQIDQTQGTLVANSNEAVSNLYRGMRRRCLDFEVVGARRKNLDDGSSSSSSLLVQPDDKIASEDKQLVPLKPSNDSLKCILPGIGLHLNALTINSKDNRNIKHETSSPGISLPSSAASFHSPTTGQEHNESMNLASTERDMDPLENGIPLLEDVSQASSYLVSDEYNQSSPKKKRRRLEGESDACKRCNCKKSKCLKLYCECFAAGVYCIEPCSCQDCFNKPVHEDTVLATRKQIESRNPLAFAPKVIRSSETFPEIGDESNKTPASARHKRGCNCKKSNCLKKYCECYQGGVGCSVNCRCEGCKNAFGRKDDAEPEDEAEACEKSEVEKISHKTEVQNNEEQNPNPALPTTPLQLCRSLAQLPFSSKNKPPRSFLGIGSTTVLYTSQKYGKPNILRSESKADKKFQTSADDEMPEILRGNYSPSTSIKTSSPNSKRVSPPSNLGSSPGRRSGRKLILQSIPAFPSLTPPALK